MSNFTPSPYMGLPIPTVGVDPGPDYANNLDTSLTLLDQHTHVPGSGQQITPQALNINSIVLWNSNPLAGLAYASFSPQGGSVASPVNYSLYVNPASGSNKGDLFYQDGSGETVQITAGGLVNATSSGISGGTATASFVSNILVVSQSTGVPGYIDASSYILRYNGASPTPAGNAIVLSAPAGLGSTYFVTFPISPPASTLPVSMNISGILSTGQITGAQIASSTITESNIVPATITGASLTSNINLPGKQAEAGGNSLVVSNDAGTQSNFGIIRAMFDSSGNLQQGGGVTVTAHNASTGVYTLTFSTAFGSSSGVVAVACTQISGTVAVIAQSTISASGLQVLTSTGGGSATNAGFSIIIVGSRA